MRSSALVLSLTTLATGCSDLGPPPTIRIVRITEYGSLAGPLTDSLGRPSGQHPDGAALGSTNGAVEGPDGTVYVLDLMTKRVVVFESDGTYRTAFGRLGQGPGEFSRPARIAVSDDGMIVVWDSDLLRLSRFNSSGVFDDATQLVNYRFTSMALIGDTAWFVRPVFRPGEYAVVGIDLIQGEPTDSFAPLNEQQASISGFGFPGKVSAGPEGELVFAGPIPIELQVRTAFEITDLGANRYPDAQGLEEENDGRVRRTSPVGVRGVAVLPTGEIAVVYEGGLPPDGLGTKGKWLELLDRRGRSLGRTDLGEVFVAGVSATRDGHLLLSVTEEFPQVWRVRIERGN